MFGTLGGTEGQLDNMLEDPNISERGRSGVDFIHTFPKGFNAGRRPTATEQNVPAYTIFGVFFIVLTLASSFLQEKKDGTFQRILAAPLSKTALLIGKLLPYYLVNLIQIAMMFCIGVVVFGMKLGYLPALVVVSLALAAAANGLGLLVAALGKTEPQVNGLSVLLAITLSALGGMMVPTFIMPNLMKTLSLFTPHAWALAGYHDIIIRGLGMKDVVTEMFVLLGFASFFFVIALWRFRFDE
jgi:ABC-2 type transport system permease protein